jgi:hypothetical protein
MDLSRFRIDHKGEVRTADFFGADFLPELVRVVDTYAAAPRAILEWGAGLSTLLFAELAARRDTTFVSIDHDADYARSVAAQVAPSDRVRLLTADLVGPKLSQADQGLSYTTLPLSLGIEFGLILIDGRRRVECAHSAFALSNPESVVLLHDYRRARYLPVTLLFEVVEDGPQFRVMRPRAELLAATETQRSHLLARLRGGEASDALSPTAAT